MMLFLSCLNILLEVHQSPGYVDRVMASDGQPLRLVCSSGEKNNDYKN